MHVGNLLFRLIALCSFAQNQSFQRTTMSNSLMSLFTKEQIAHKKGVIRSKNSYFSYVLTVFPLFMPKHKSHPMSDSLRSLMTKAQPWAIRSFSQANHSFAHKKRANRSKNRWVDSQPWRKLTDLFNLIVTWYKASQLYSMMMMFQQAAFLCEIGDAGLYFYINYGKQYTK